jgi:hypothetical protein
MSKLKDVAVATNNLCNSIDTKRAEYYAAQEAQKNADKATLAAAYTSKTSTRTASSVAASNARKAEIAAELVIKEAKLAELLGVEGAAAGNGSIWGIMAMAADKDADTRAYHAATALVVENARAAYLNDFGTIGDFDLGAFIG